MNDMSYRLMEHLRWWAAYFTTGGTLRRYPSLPCAIHLRVQTYLSGMYCSLFVVLITRWPKICLFVWPSTWTRSFRKLRRTRSRRRLLNGPSLYINSIKYRRMNETLQQRGQHVFLQCRVSSAETSSEPVRSWAHLQKVRKKAQKMYNFCLNRGPFLSWRCLNRASLQLRNRRFTLQLVLQISVVTGTRFATPPPLWHPWWEDIQQVKHPSPLA